MFVFCGYFTAPAANFEHTLTEHFLDFQSFAISDGVMSHKNNGTQQNEHTNDEEVKPTTSLQLADCFHGFITKKKAESRLLECGVEGSFLLRVDQNSSYAKQKYCLSWLSPTDHSVKHFPYVVKSLFPSSIQRLLP